MLTLRLIHRLHRSRWAQPVIGRPHASPGSYAPIRPDDSIGVDLRVELGGPPHGRVSGSPSVHASDATLLARLRASDAGALDALLDRYWSPVFLYALRVTGSEDAAADVAQSLFCRVWERRTTWRADGSVRGLLFRMARNIAVSAHRRERAQDRAMLAFAESAPTSTLPERAAESAELRAALERAIAELPARRREVFLLRMVDDLSYAEIAHVMGTSKQTVANQLSRALATLRCALGSLLDQGGV